MLRRIFSYMKQYKKYAYLALFCIAVEVVLELMVPLIMADLIDTGVANADEMYIYKKGIQMVCCAAAALFFGIGSSRFSALAGQGLGANLRKAEYEKLQSYSFTNIDHFRVSSLVTRLTSDVTNIQNSVSTGMRPFGRRAAVSKPPVLILDEATSSIDTRTERFIEKGMDAIMEGRTVFVIAHRLSTVRNSKAIMVLEKGEIIERGSHDELLEQKGRYYRLYTGQFELE